MNKGQKLCIPVYRQGIIIIGDKVVEAKVRTYAPNLGVGQLGWYRVKRIYKTHNTGGDSIRIKDF